MRLVVIISRRRIEGTTDRISSTFSNIAKGVKNMYAYMTGNTDKRVEVVNMAFYYIMCLQVCLSVYLSFYCRFVIFSTCGTYSKKQKDWVIN